jgi:hypothetical protein
VRSRWLGRWRWYLPPKHQCTYGLHGVTFKKMPTIILY